ncbi:hypothetical protein LJK88_45135 [Paenibacillus sp. P26]|nr:hypothetical protein LJK88_45135 [Paenibacillus sp. P26]
MTVVLFESGIMLLQVAGTLEAKIGIAFLVGFGFGKVMDKLKALTETLFNGKNDKTPPGTKRRMRNPASGRRKKEAARAADSLIERKKSL